MTEPRDPDPTIEDVPEAPDDQPDEPKTDPVTEPPAPEAPADECP